MAATSTNIDATRRNRRVRLRLCDASITVRPPRPCQAAAYGVMVSVPEATSLSLPMSATVCTR